MWILPTITLPVYMDVINLCQYLLYVLLHLFSSTLSSKVKWGSAFFIWSKHPLITVNILSLTIVSSTSSRKQSWLNLRYVCQAGVTLSIHGSVPVSANIASYWNQVSSLIVISKQPLNIQKALNIDTLVRKGPCHVSLYISIRLYLMCSTLVKPGSNLPTP